MRAASAALRCWTRWCPVLRSPRQAAAQPLPQRLVHRLRGLLPGAAAPLRPAPLTHRLGPGARDLPCPPAGRLHGRAGQPGAAGLVRPRRQPVPCLAVGQMRHAQARHPRPPASPLPPACCPAGSSRSSSSRCSSSSPGALPAPACKCMARSGRRRSTKRSRTCGLLCRLIQHTTTAASLLRAICCLSWPAWAHSRRSSKTSRSSRSSSSSSCSERCDAAAVRQLNITLRQRRQAARACLLSQPERPISAPTALADAAFSPARRQAISASTLRQSAAGGSSGSLGGSEDGRSTDDAEASSSVQRTEAAAAATALEETSVPLSRLLWRILAQLAALWVLFAGLSLEKEQWALCSWQYALLHGIQAAVALTLAALFVWRAARPWPEEASAQPILAGSVDGSCGDAATAAAAAEHCPLQHALSAPQAWTVRQLALASGVAVGGGAVAGMLGHRRRHGVGAAAAR